MQFNDYLTPKNLSNWCCLLDEIRSSRYFDPIKFDIAVIKAEIFLIDRRNEDILGLMEPTSFTEDHKHYFNNLRSIFSCFCYGNRLESQNRFCEYLANILANDTVHLTKKSWINFYDTFFFTENFASLKKDCQDAFISGFVFIRDFLSLLADPNPDYSKFKRQSGETIAWCKIPGPADQHQEVENSAHQQNKEQHQHKEAFKAELKAKFSPAEIVEKFLPHWLATQIKIGVPVSVSKERFLKYYGIEDYDISE